MLCFVRYLFIISTSVIDCVGRFVPEMTYYVSSGTLNLPKLKHLECLYLTSCNVITLWLCQMSAQSNCPPLSDGD